MRGIEGLTDDDNNVYIVNPMRVATSILFLCLGV